MSSDGSYNQEGSTSLGDIANAGGKIAGTGDVTLTSLSGSVLNLTQTHEWQTSQRTMGGTGIDGGIDATALITSGGSLTVTLAVVFIVPSVPSPIPPRALQPPSSVSAGLIFVETSDRS